MVNAHKADLLTELRQRFGELRKLSGSQSLFAIGDDAARLYFRYSKVHEGGRTFFGLRDVDLRQLEGHNSFLCLLLDDGSLPVFIPYADFEEVFRAAEPASDGQFKVQICASEQSRELYVARQGRFNIDGYIGFDILTRSLDANRLKEHCCLQHSQVQTLLGAIGALKGFEVWIPDHDIGLLDWTLTKRFQMNRTLPAGYDDVSSILGEIDVIWMDRGGNRIEALFEVEHSTPVYSGLLRFNDLLLISPRLSRFHIVSNDTRRALFSRQAFRPTFRKSGLSEIVSFIEYPNVFEWHSRLSRGRIENAQ